MLILSVPNLISNHYAAFHKTLIFLMRLAWKSGIRLPYLIMIGFMVLDIRVTIEIGVDAEHRVHGGNDVNHLEDSNNFEESSDLEDSDE